MSVKNGVSAVAKEVVDDVQKEAETIILNAEKEALETLKAAKEQATKNYQSIMSQAAAKAESEKRKIASVTEVEMRNRVLQTKESLVDVAFEKVQNELKVFVETEKYHSYLLKLVEEASKRISQKNLVVQVNAKDKAWLTQDVLNGLSKKIQVQLQVAVETGSFIGGCRIETEDGKVTYDSTIDNRLNELKPILRVEAAKILFEGEN